MESNKQIQNFKEEEEEQEEDFLFSSELFINKSYIDKIFDFSNNIKVKITLTSAATTDFDLTGQALWPAANVLTEYIIQNQHLFQDKKVLELGAGVGVCGLVASRFASETVLTDHNSIVLELLEKNITNNLELIGKSPSQVKSLLLNWGQNLDWFEKEFEGGFDVILGSEIIFWQQSLPALIETVDRLLSKQKEGSFFITSYYERSKQGEDKFKELINNQDYIISEIPLSTLFSQEKLSSFNGIHLLICRKK